MDETVRLNKYLAEAGVCSRREADRLIASGEVYINGDIATVGMRVSAADRVTLRGEELVKEQRVVYAFNKPKGVTCTEYDPHADIIITDYTGDIPERVTYVGRLDRDSEGLMLLTNDGYFTKMFMRSGHEREYVVSVYGEVDEAFIEGMRKGVYLEELERTTKPCKVWRSGAHSFHIVLTEGLNRQIRRMCKAFGLGVRSLKRIRIADILLGDLKSGTHRELTGDELKSLMRICGL